MGGCGSSWNRTELRRNLYELVQAQRPEDHFFSPASDLEELFRFFQNLGDTYRTLEKLVVSFRASETLRDLQRPSETFRDLQRSSENV